MAISFKCVSCHARLTTPGGTAGRRGRCPRCGAIMLLRTPAAPESDVHRTPPASRALGAGEAATWPCPRCGKLSPVTMTACECGYDLESEDEIGTCKAVERPRSSSVGSAGSKPAGFECGYTSLVMGFGSWMTKCFGACLAMVLIYVPIRGCWIWWQGDAAHPRQQQTVTPVERQQDPRLRQVAEELDRHSWSIGQTIADNLRRSGEGVKSCTLYFNASERTLLLSLELSDASERQFFEQTTSDVQLQLAYVLTVSMCDEMAKRHLMFSDWPEIVGIMISKQGLLSLPYERKWRVANMKLPSAYRSMYDVR